MCPLPGFQSQIEERAFVAVDMTLYALCDSILPTPQPLRNTANCKQNLHHMKSFLRPWM
jgi:hypothetical protein